VADLEGGDAAFAFTSGMAALAAVLRLVPAGGHVVAGDDLYGGTSRLLERVAPGVGVSVSNVDTCDVGAVKAALQPGKTALLMLESPTNPRMQVADLRALADAAHAAGALVCVDNSVMAPTFQRPLDLGADLSMTSATKFINGHSDVMAGTVAVRGADLAARVAFLQNAEGAGLAPFDCWLTLRGLKTMDLRMRAAADNAAALAFFLDGHPMVTSVLWPGLASHPGAALHACNKPARSHPTLTSLSHPAPPCSLALSRALVEATSLFVVAVSFGSLASQISLPCYMSHASILAAVRARA
jgi:cystathionine beta-lyase